LRTQYKCIFLDTKNLTYYIKTQINGVVIFKRGFLTIDDAKNTLDSIRELKLNSLGKVKYITFNSLIESFKKYKKCIVSIQTYNRVIYLINKYILDHIPNIKINLLEFNHFNLYREYVDSLHLSIISKNRLLNLLQEIFRFCKIYHNFECIYPERLIPFKDYSIKKPVNSFNVFTINDFKKLYPSLNNYDKLLLLTFYLFGLRIGEIMGLSVLSFTAYPSTMCIYQSVSWKTKKRGFEKLSPKTKKSRRNYPLPSKYYDLIFNHIKNNKLKDEDFIFFGRNKKHPISEHAINYRLKKWSDVVGFHINSHLFRHSSVTTLSENNIDLSVISELVGHSSTKITKEVYLHQTKQKTRALTDFMDNLID